MIYSCPEPFVEIQYNNSNGPLLSDSLVFRNILLTLMASLLCAGCFRKNKIENEIAKKASVCNEECVIKLSDLTTFGWDKVYIFQALVPAEFIDEALGMHYEDYVEATRTIIFVKNNKIVYAENDPLGDKGPRDGDVVFTFTAGDRYQLLTPAQAVFSVTHKNLSMGEYYILKLK